MRDQGLWLTEHVPPRFLSAGYQVRPYRPMPPTLDTSTAPRRHVGKVAGVTTLCELLRRPG
jgi:hypothetical protein